MGETLWDFFKKSMFKTMAKQWGDGTSGGEHAIIVAV